MPEGFPRNAFDVGPRHRDVWLVAANVALIVYASLFPFQFEASGQALASFVGELAFEQPTRGDLVANILLYAPFGFCVALVALRRSRSARSIAAAVASGLALSFCMEALQTASPSRVASLTDVAANGVGASLGAVAGIALASGTLLRLRGFAPSQTALPAIVATMLWLAARLAPFLPTIDWQKYKDALKPLLVAPAFGALDTLAFAVGWIVVAHAFRELWPRFALRAWLATALAVVAAQVVIVDRSVSPAEVAALAAALPAAVLLGRLDTHKAVTILAAATAAIVVLQGLEPFALAAEPQDFGWIPFEASIIGGPERGARVIFEKSFWYFCLVWLLASAGLRLAPAALASTLLVASIEAAQVSLPTRTPEITDPLIVLLLAWLLHAITKPTRTRA